MKKFNPTKALQEVIDFRKSKLAPKSMHTDIYLRASQGMKLLPLLAKKFQSVNIATFKSDYVSKMYKDEEDRNFKGKFMKISVSERY